ncbi:MAG: hypothetical protein ABI629_13780 [bacterium]
MAASVISGRAVGQRGTGPSAPYQQRAHGAARVRTIDIGDIVADIDVQDDQRRRARRENAAHHEVLEIRSHVPDGVVGVVDCWLALVEQCRKRFRLAHPGAVGDGIAQVDDQRRPRFAMLRSAAQRADLLIEPVAEQH